MNKKAESIYNYICKRIESDYPPTVREICNALHISSTSTVHRYIKQLVAEGKLEKIDNQNRAIRLPGKGARNVPLIGTITAGEPITAVEHIDGYVSFIPQGYVEDDLFALRVRGESMVEVGIFDGDVVVVEPCDYVPNGTIAAVLVDDEEATVKRFYREDNHYRLQPENRTMKPIYTDNAAILGRVIALIRYLDN